MLIILVLIFVLSLFLFYASYSIRSGVYIKTLNRNPLKGKTIALTFDDGPDPIQTPKILDILKEHKIKACFFCIGHKIKGNEELIKRIINEGHIIGNHSFSHSAFFPLHSANWIKNDLKSCQTLLESATGENSKLFRPPFGVTNPMIAKAVKQLGYITIGWSIRSLDSCKNKDATFKRFKRHLNKGDIVLLHDPLPESDVLLIDIIHYLNENNYKTERVDSLLNIKLI